MSKLKFNLLQRDAFLCTVLTFIVAAIIYGVFVNLSFLDPFEKAFKDFYFTDIFYSKKFKEAERNDKIILVNVKHADRFTIANAIQKVSDLSPKVIGLDMIFKERRMAFTDSILNSVLTNNDNIVTSYYRDGDSLVTNEPYFKSRPEKAGYINLNLEGQNSVIRDFVGVKEQEELSYSFATQLAIHSGLLDKEFADKKLTHRLPINYIGNKEAFLSFDIDDVVSEEDIPAFKDAIVIFGYLGDGDDAFDIEDKHFTPLNSAWVGRSVPDTFGVTIHANVVHMLTKGQFIKRAPKFIIYILSFFICYLVILLGMKIYKRSNLAYDLTLKIIQLVVSIVLLYLALVLLKSNLYVNTAPILILSVLGIEMIDYYVYLISYLNKKYQWQSYILESSSSA